LSGVDQLAYARIYVMNIITILEALILGGLQGATEFLPVSSSGHLLLAAKVFEIPVNFAAETLLNFGTIAVIAIFFWKQIWRVVKDLLTKALNLREKKDVVAKLVIGILPAVIVGVLLGDFIETHLHGTGTVVVMLIAIGLPMILFRNYHHSKVEKLNTNIVQQVSYKQALAIGFVQPLALVSGTSRSGITILTGMLTGLSVEVAAAFSFLIGLPVILGATLMFLVSSDGSDFLSSNLSAFIWGNVASFAVGLVAVYALMDVVKKKGLRPFGIYRIVLAVAVALFVLL
jgi:undecaprenyl-diphosphatase